MKSKVLVGGFQLRVFPHRKYSTSWGKKVSSSFETEYRVHRDIDWVDAGPTGTPILKMSVSLHGIRTLYKRLVCGQQSSLSRTIVSLPGSDRQVQADSPNGKLTKVLKNAEERWHLPFINRTVYRFSTDEEARAAKHRLEAEGAVFYYARSDLNVQTDIRKSKHPTRAVLVENLREEDLATLRSGKALNFEECGVLFITKDVKYALIDFDEVENAKFGKNKLEKLFPSAKYSFVHELYTNNVLRWNSALERSASKHCSKYWPSEVTENERKEISLAALRNGELQPAKSQLAEYFRELVPLRETAKKLEAGSLAEEIGSSLERRTSHSKNAKEAGASHGPDEEPGEEDQKNDTAGRARSRTKTAARKGSDGDTLSKSCGSKRGSGDAEVEIDINIDYEESDKGTVPSPETTLVDNEDLSSSLTSDQLEGDYEEIMDVSVNPTTIPKMKESRKKKPETRGRPRKTEKPVELTEP